MASSSYSSPARDSLDDTEGRNIDDRILSLHSYIVEICQCVTFKEEIELFLRSASFRLLYLYGHVKGEKQLVSFKQTCNVKKSQHLL